MARASEPFAGNIILRARVQTSAWSLRTSAGADEASTGVRGEGSRRNGWREPASPRALAPDQRAASPPERASVADPSRAGTAGGEVAQGAGLATRAHPLVERSRRGRATRDDQPRHTHAGRGSRSRGHAGEERASGGRLTTSRREPTPAAPRSHSQAQRGDTRPRESDEAGPGQASSALARPRTDRRNTGRPQLVGVSSRTLGGGRERAMLRRAVAQDIRALGVSRRHQRVC